MSDLPVYFASREYDVDAHETMYTHSSRHARLENGSPIIPPLPSPTASVDASTRQSPLDAIMEGSDAGLTPLSDSLGHLSSTSSTSRSTSTECYQYHDVASPELGSICSPDRNATVAHGMTSNTSLSDDCQDQVSTHEHDFLASAIRIRRGGIEDTAGYLKRLDAVLHEMGIGAELDQDFENPDDSDVSPDFDNQPPSPLSNSHPLAGAKHDEESHVDPVSRPASSSAVDSESRSGGRRSIASLRSLQRMLQSNPVADRTTQSPARSATLRVRPATRQATQQAAKPPKKAAKQALAPIERRATRLSGVKEDARLNISLAQSRRTHSTQAAASRMPRELRRLRDTKEFSHQDDKPIVYTVWSNGKYVPANAAGEPLPEAKTSAKGSKAREPQSDESAEKGSAGEDDVSIEVETPSVKRPKLWLDKGLFAGQPTPASPCVGLTTSERKVLEMLPELAKKSPPNKVLPMPIFGGMRMLIQGRHFKMPYDVFNPLPPGQPKPVKYGRFSKNRFVGEAHAIWKKSPSYDDFQSKCVCKPETGCDEDCQNRIMLYECNDDICNVGSELCNNREFQRLAERTASKNPYHIGVEVFKTANWGHGIRASRSFRPGQIIMEYIGEIITEEESDRRMNDLYKSNACYYLMSFDQSLIIDGTSGSIARFVNHSCSPNCRMIKWIVCGQPRIALFAGDRPIMSGEELTYDYNFDPYSSKNVQRCLCGSENCRGVLGPRKGDKAAKAAAKTAKLEASKKTTAVSKSQKRKIDVYSPNDANITGGPALKKVRVLRGPVVKVTTTKAALEALAADAAKVAKATKAAKAAKTKRIAKEYAAKVAEVSKPVKRIKVVKNTAHKIVFTKKAAASKTNKTSNSKSTPKAEKAKETTETTATTATKAKKISATVGNKVVAAGKATKVTVKSTIANRRTTLSSQASRTSKAPTTKLPKRVGAKEKAPEPVVKKRGRPPKKAASAAATARAAKAREAKAAKTAKAAIKGTNTLKTPRAAKATSTAQAYTPTETDMTETPPDTPVKRGRGRPKLSSHIVALRKARVAAMVAGKERARLRAAEERAAAAAKRAAEAERAVLVTSMDVIAEGQQLVAQSNAQSAGNTVATADPPRRKRGRPRKVAVELVVSTAMNVDAPINTATAQSVKGDNSEATEDVIHVARTICM